MKNKIKKFIFKDLNYLRSFNENSKKSLSEFEKNIVKKKIKYLKF
jgi:hypothetical protein